MHRNVILRAILTFVTITVLIAPTTAQNPPPPRTPTPPESLIVDSVGSAGLQTGKAADVTGAFPTPLAPGLSISDSIIRGTPSILELESKPPLRGKDQSSDLKAYLLSQGIGIQQLTDSASSWSLYEDPEFGYVVVYPSEWGVRHSYATVQSPSVRRVRTYFEGASSSQIAIDVWANEDNLDLMTWFDVTQKPYIAESSIEGGFPNSINTTLNGLPALSFVQPPAENSGVAYRTYIAYEDVVFLIHYTALDGGIAFDIYQDMLRSFAPKRLVVGEDSIPPMPSPSSYQQRTSALCPSGASGKCSYRNQDHNCCDIDGSNNPFRCSIDDSTHVDKGNCVWWATHEWPKLGQDIANSPYRGCWSGTSNSSNASDWLCIAEREGYATGSQPQPGSIWWVKPGTRGTGSDGHVAYVISTSGNSFHLSEMMWCYACRRERDTTVQSTDRFIYRSSTCPAPTLSSPAPDHVSPGNTVTFVWTHPGNCTGQNGYLLRVGTTSGGSDVVSDHGVQGLQTNYTFDSQWHNRDLYWSVRANASGAPWSESRHFRIEPNQGGGCSGCSSYVTNLSFNPDTPSNATSVNINASIRTDFPNFRAARIRVVNGDTVCEQSTFNFSCTWDTRSTPNGDNCIVLEIDDNQGASWDNPETCYHAYHLDPRPTPPPDPPAQPYSPADGSSHSAGTSFTLNWQPSANATAYQVHLEGGPGTSRDSDWISAHLWSVGTLSSGNYKWKVRARNQYGTSAYSAEWTFTVQEGTPNAPSDLSASAVSQSQINLAWSDNSSNETGFRLYREGLLAATLGAGTTTYQDIGLECGRGYNYYIVAYNDAGQSGHSNTASATTQSCPPTAPPSPNPVSPAQDTTFNCGDEITLVWDDLGNGVEYYAETWGANNRTSGWQRDNSWYLGEQDGTRTWWHVKARYVGETDESGWGSTTWFNVNSCPQYPDLRPYAPSGYQYPAVPSMVEGTYDESTLYVDQPTYFDWHFINDGNDTASGDFHVELWVDSEQILRYPYSNMGTGWVWGFDDLGHTVSTPGWHTVRLVTDPDGTIDESDESNNEWTRDFYWHIPCNDLNEYNDEYGQATALNYGETASGDICPLSDKDYYEFYGQAGETIVADVDAQVLGSNLDSVLALYDSDGTTELTTNDDYGASLDSRIVYDLPHNGYYYLRVREYNDGGEAGGDYFYDLSLAGAESAPYSRDFEGDTSGWDTDGMWHLVDDNSPYPGSYSSPRGWWYGQDATGDYDDGEANSGSLASPPIYIPDTGYYLRFKYWYETETQGLDYDRRCVQISVDNGPYSELHCLSDDGMGWWHSSPAIDLSDLADHIVRVRFNFDTVDELYNGFRGWYIDDFEISDTAPPSCSDGNEPNDSHSTATAIAYGETKSGYICPGGDLDYFTFTGNAGDTIVADINADVSGSSLDSVLVLLDSDGVTELASNDNAETGSLDSLLGYTLPSDGTYYLKIRDYEHPSYGDSNYYYDLSLVVDNSDPTGTFLAPTTGTYITSTGHISITAEASDVGSGVRNVTFLWHSGDWSNPDWEVLGEDWDGADGWAVDWDVGSLPDQSGAALYAWAFDWGGNWVGMECWGLTLDREPPVTSMEMYAPYGGASFLDFWLTWYGDDLAAGIADYDIQYRDGITGTWTDLIIDTTDTYTHLIGEDGHTYYFRSRARDWAGNAGEYPPTAQISYTVQICPVGMDDWEIDDTSADANSISTDGTVQTRNFDIPGDQDWVKLDAVEGQRYVLQTENVGGYADTVLHIYDTDGSTLLDINDDFEGLGWASQIAWTAPSDGVYYVMVKHWDEHAYGCETVYTLSISQGYEVFLPITLRSY